MRRLAYAAAAAALLGVAGCDDLVKVVNDIIGPSSNPEPADPTPSDPTPSDPAPSDPAPSDPAPSDPAPSDPTPSDPTPSDPPPSDPEPEPEPEPVSPPPPPPLTIPDGGDFSFHGVGKLAPGSGEGTPDPTVWSPGIIFPIKEFRTYLNSQVYGYGGAFGPAGNGWCDDRNYAYPWRDNFCEKRSSANRQTLNCPSDKVHQGQDIRAGTGAMCNTIRKTDPATRDQIPIVAVEDGFISYIGSYTINLRAEDRIYRYMHLNMKKLSVAEGDEVKAGDLIGYLSNDFEGTPTTLHLHLEFKQNIDGVGWTWVSPYMSLVRAYERAIGKTGTLAAE